MEQMEILVIIGQRKERYPGEYAPEVLAAIDEFGNDDNPEYLETELKGHKDSNDFENIVTVTLQVDYAKIKKLLRPGAPVIKAKIVDEVVNEIADEA